MSSQNPNYLAIERHYQGSDSKDIDAMMAPITDQTAWTEMAGFPCAGTYQGPEQIIENVFVALDAEWDGYRFELERLLDASNSIIGVGTYYAQHKKSGKAMQARVVHVWDLEEGKVTGFEQFTDTLLVDQARR